jgi:hypothetical protein
MASATSSTKTGYSRVGPQPMSGSTGSRASSASYHVLLKSKHCDVRYESLAEVEARLPCFRSSPSSRHHPAQSGRPVVAIADVSAAERDHALKQWR